MAQVIWSASAIQDLAEIRAYLAQFNPSAAQAVAARIIAASNSLITFPERGRLIHNSRRELALVWPYVIRYGVTRGDIHIIRIRHGARRPD